MRPTYSWRESTGLQVGIIVVALLGSILAGVSYLVLDSPYVPLVIGGVVLGALSTPLWIRKPVLVLYAAMLVVFLPTGLFPANLQSILNRTLTLVALGVWLVYILIHRQHIRWSVTLFMMIAFLIWCLVTLVWSDNLTIAVNVLGGYVFRFILFLFLFANGIRSRENFEGLMTALAIAGWVFILAGISSLITNGYELGSRLQVLEANENSLGGIFPVVVVGVIWLVIRASNLRKLFWMVVSTLFLLLSFLLIALSGSRGSAITWLITMLVMLFWRPTRIWGIIGLLILVTAAAAAPLVLSTTLERFTDRLNDTLLGGREALWQAGWLLIRQHPLTGVGVGNSPYAMKEIIRSFRSIFGFESAPIHNPILAIWADTGILGLLLYLGVFASAIWTFASQFFRLRKFGVNWLMPYFALAFAAFCGYFASWIKGGGMETDYSFFLMLGLMVLPSHLEL
jgi:putative inorganic carbon (hco3(-)) transporter